MKIIPLTQGVIAIVDDHQFKKLNRHKWSASFHSGRWYAVRVYDEKSIRMHREILVAPASFDVDHIHRDDDFGVIDNREINLRLTTRKQNLANQRKQGNCSSIFKGVYRHKDGFWVAQIKASDGRIHLGSFQCEKDAALAYDRAAKKYFGEFAHLNFNQQQKQ